jgi:hypothetical protein
MQLSLEYLSVSLPNGRMLRRGELSHHPVKLLPSIGAHLTVVSFPIVSYMGYYGYEMRARYVRSLIVYVEKFAFTVKKNH